MSKERSSSEVAEQLAELTRGSVEVLNLAELKKRLARGDSLRVKAGFDPTAADLHLGHTVLMQKLRQFQQLGHKVVFLIGDFTARIGDPSGRNETRPALAPDQIAANAETYKEQAFRILDPDLTELHSNGEWMEPMTAAGLIELAASTTVARMLERDDFSRRYKGEQSISLHEFLYPLIQAWDSVQLRSDVELGGTDQTFNLLLGRELQRANGQEPQVVMTMPLLEGTDGVQKMSKSLDNTIGITEPPAEIYGKVMSISDTLMQRYYELLSDVDQEFVVELREGKHEAMEAKKGLAAELTARFHGEDAALAAAEEFARRHQRGELPSEIPEWDWQGSDSEVRICDLLKASGLAKSASEGRRLVRQGGVKLDGKKISDEMAPVAAQGRVLVQVGKRRVLAVKFTR
jgi:tyrosyl-tRNA synthetase